MIELFCIILAALIAKDFLYSSLSYMGKLFTKVKISIRKKIRVYKKRKKAKASSL